MALGKSGEGREGLILTLCQSHNADPCMSRSDINLLVSEKFGWQLALGQADVGVPYGAEGPGL